MTQEQLERLDDCYHKYNLEDKCDEERINARKLLCGRRFDLYAILLYIDHKVKGATDMSYAISVYKGNSYSTLIERLMPWTIADSMALESLKWHDDLFMMILWPKAFLQKENVEKATDMIATESDVMYVRDLPMQYNDTRNLMLQLYGHMDWVGSIDNDFASTYSKADEVWDNCAMVRFVMVRAEDCQHVLTLKKKIRDLFGIGLASIHSTDTMLETSMAANAVFNPNSRHFIHYANPTKFKESYKKFDKFRSIAINNNIDRESIIVDSGMALSIYGVRETSDLDFCSLQGTYTEPLLEVPDFEEHDSRQKSFYPCPGSELIEIPSNYFTYYGIKFVSLNRLLQMKQNRLATDKDIKDIKDIKRLLNDTGGRFRDGIFHGIDGLELAVSFALDGQPFKSGGDGHERKSWDYWIEYFGKIISDIQGLLNPYLNAYLPPFVSWEKFKLQCLSPKKLAVNIMAKRIWRHGAMREREIFGGISNYLGRTSWDERLAHILNPSSRYYHVDEILRGSFYTARERAIPQKLTIVTTISQPLYKGFDLVLKTAKLLKDSLKLDFEWQCFGNIEPDFVEKITGIRHQDVNVRLMGVATQEQLAEAELNATLYFHSSYIDNSPNSLCEAQMSGLPVVSTNVGGIQTLVAEGETGFLVPSNDPYQAAYLIEKIFLDRDLNTTLGKNARNAALKRHNPETVKKQILEVYDALLKHQ